MDNTTAIRDFLYQNQGLIAIGLLFLLGIGINYKSKTVVTKAPDNVIKITITKDQLQ